MMRAGRSGAGYATRSVRGARTLAARHLVEQGMVILDRNWRCELGELDLVARRRRHPGGVRGQDPARRGVRVTGRGGHLAQGCPAAPAGRCAGSTSTRSRRSRSASTSSASSVSAAVRPAARAPAWGGLRCRSPGPARSAWRACAGTWSRSRPTSPPACRRCSLVGSADASLNEARDRCRAAVVNSRLPVAAAQGHHRPVAGVAAQGGRALRPGDRGGGAGRRVARCRPSRWPTPCCSASWRSTAGCGRCPGCCPATLAVARAGSRRGCSCPRPTSPRRLRSAGCRWWARGRCATWWRCCAARSRPTTRRSSRCRPGADGGWRGEDRVAGLDLRDVRGQRRGPLRPRGGRRRRPPPAAARSARRRQDDAGRAAAGPAARPRPRPGARGDRGALGRRACSLPTTRCVRRPPFLDPHHTASLVSVIGGGSRLIRPGAVSLGPPRRAVHGRGAGVPGQRPRGAAPAAGERPDRDQPGGAHRVVPGPVPAGAGHERLPVRPGRPHRRRLHVHADGQAALPRAAVRADPRPHRPAPRGAPAASGTSCTTSSTRPSRRRWWPSGSPRRASGSVRGCAARRGGATPTSPAASCGAGGRCRPRPPRRWSGCRAPGGVSARGADRVLRVAWTLADLAGRRPARSRPGAAGRRPAGRPALHACRRRPVAPRCGGGVVSRAGTASPASTPDRLARVLAQRAHRARRPGGGRDGRCGRRRGHRRAARLRPGARPGWRRRSPPTRRRSDTAEAVLADAERRRTAVGLSRATTSGRPGSTTSAGIIDASRPRRGAARAVGARRARRSPRSTDDGRWPSSVPGRRPSTATRWPARSRPTWATAGSVRGQRRGLRHRRGGAPRRARRPWPHGRGARLRRRRGLPARPRRAARPHRRAGPGGERGATGRPPDPGPVPGPQPADRRDVEPRRVVVEAAWRSGALNTLRWAR